ncbi:rhodanese-like domain-containing protein [Candidatus Woesearchaeota archaeon]|nr:rhodanese-like domain-containing protein [Candidatus Woesearchaeota archaeon]
MQLDHEAFTDILYQEKRVHILDVREHDEFAKAHIKGSINIPLAMLKITSEELYGPLKQKKVYLITPPLAAREALDELEKRGFQNVHHVTSEMKQIMKSIPPERKGGTLHESVTVPS